MVESLVLQVLDVISRTAGIAARCIAGEDDVVAMIEMRMNPRTYGPVFCAPVLRKWRSNAVSSVLRARGVLQTGIAKHEQSQADFSARQRADVAQHGLWDCALPSCSKTETSVKEFAGCTGCRSVVYCCVEHQALDWKAHKKACREKKARLVADEAAADKAHATEEDIPSQARLTTADGVTNNTVVVPFKNNIQALARRLYTTAIRFSGVAPRGMRISFPPTVFEVSG